MLSILDPLEMKRMTSVKATLTVSLKANDVVVAELEDPALWQRVLAAINLQDSGTQVFESMKQSRAAVPVAVPLAEPTPMPAPKSGGYSQNGSPNGAKDWSAWAEQAK